MARTAFGDSTRCVNAMASRAEEDQIGRSSPRSSTWPLGPGCSSSVMPQKWPAASCVSAAGGEGLAVSSSPQAARANEPRRR